MSDVKIRRAILSVSDKTGVIDLGKALTKLGIEILSTGGTASILREGGVSVTDVAEYTSAPEILGGRVKTLHPIIHGGLLARENLQEDCKELSAENISFIDMVVVNLYPFEKTVQDGENFDTCIENIDIGGPTMLRAAAKNHNRVTVIVSPDDYEELLNEVLSNDGSTSREFRKKMAAKAFRHTASYDSHISNWFTKENGESYPEKLNVTASLRDILRYGENPHQTAALYTVGSARFGVPYASQVQGKELSFNNINDSSAALDLVCEFSDPCCAIIKHANPCGVAIAENIYKSYLAALSCDTESAFGGIVAFNREVGEDVAKEVVRLFAEVVLAPSISKKAKEIFETKQNLRVLELGNFSEKQEDDIDIRTLSGGILIQKKDQKVTENSIKIVTKKIPTEQEMKDLKFAFTVCKHVKSNAIVYAKNGTTVGVGAGQMSRVNSSRIASWKAADQSKAAGEPVSRAIGSVVASDAFFPFPDGLLSAAEAGATAVIQPGGSIRDDEVIEAADKAGLAMVFTGMRHFKH